MLFRCFQFRLTFESIKKLGNASGRTPPLRVDNYLHFLIVVINDTVDVKIIKEQIFQKMKLVVSIHENVQFNVEQAQKKQKKTYATRKGKQTFERFVTRLIMVKMKKPWRNKALTLSWEGP